MGLVTMRVLKSQRNDHPKWYAEYPLDILKITVDRFDDEMVEKVEKDIEEKGLIHPIVIRSPYLEYQTEPNPDASNLSTSEKQKVFNIFIGNQRVTAAKKLGYTHISAYHVKRDEDARMLCEKTQMREFVTNW
jgi:hypothetical protein